VIQDDEWIYPLVDDDISKLVVNISGAREHLMLTQDNIIRANIDEPMKLRALVPITVRTWIGRDHTAIHRK
jgi:hypothetical protein